MIDINICSYKFNNKKYLLNRSDQVDLIVLEISMLYKCQKSEPAI